MRLALALTLLAAAPLAAQSPTPDDAEILRLGDKLTRWVFSGEVDSALAHMSPKLQEGLRGREGLAEAAADLGYDFGRETKVIMETVTRGGGVPEYWRMSQYSEIGVEPYVVHWVFDAEGRANGVGLAPLSNTPAAR